MRKVRLHGRQRDDRVSGGRGGNQDRAGMLHDGNWIKHGDSEYEADSDDVLKSSVNSKVARAST